VFVGRVIEDSGEGSGKGPAKMIVEEVLHGLPKETRELTVDTGAGTSRYMRLQKDESYVIYGRSVTGTQNHVSRDWCSFSFQVHGNELLLAALRQMELKGDARLVGKVQMMYKEYDVSGEGAAGVSVVATSGEAKLATVTNANGEFEFSSVAPGQYHLEVPSPDFFADQFRWPRVDPRVAASSCGYQNLFVWPNGRIEGTVRSSDGKPIEGVPVQVFTKDRHGEIDHSPLRQEKTDANGHYALSGLPAGEFVVAVNGEKYDDRTAWPPRFYPGTPNRDSAAWLHCR